MYTHECTHLFFEDSFQEQAPYFLPALLYVVCVPIDLLLAFCSRLFKHPILILTNRPALSAQSGFLTRIQFVLFSLAFHSRAYSTAKHYIAAKKDCEFYGVIIFKSRLKYFYGSQSSDNPVHQLSLLASFKMLASKNRYCITTRVPNFIQGSKRSICVLVIATHPFVQLKRECTA